MITSLALVLITFPIPLALPDACAQQDPLARYAGQPIESITFVRRTVLGVTERPTADDVDTVLRSIPLEVGSPLDADRLREGGNALADQGIIARVEVVQRDRGLELIVVVERKSVIKQDGRPRVREAGIQIGDLQPGPLNAITDVGDVRVGHATLIQGDDIRTGVTVILPHGGNLFQEKVPAAVHVGNAFGKLMGSTQVQELGNIEAPIALTNTLNVGLVADALIGYMLDQEGNERVRSINVVVGETNDGGMNDIRGRHVKEAHVRQALADAKGGPVTEGSVGAGTGTSAFGYKGGIGTSSRVTGDYTVGVLVQSNFGGSLTVSGVPVYKELRQGRRGRQEQDQEYGSCMMVVATDAPLDSRNLERLAMRALAGMARTGASFSNGSGDFVISFSTAESQRITGGPTTGGAVLDNGRMSGLFRAAAEATEEAILNSMFQATAVTGRGTPLPVDRVVEIVKRQRGG